MSKEIKLRDSSPKKVWYGKYRGISFEINNFKFAGIESGKEQWTYYLYLDPEEFEPSLWLEPKENDYSRITYEYYRHPISDIYWHGGVTWYEKRGGQEKESKTVKVGCDYNHLWDRDKIYDLEDIKRDIKKTIDEFHEKFPEYDQTNNK